MVTMVILYSVDMVTLVAMVTAVSMVAIVGIGVVGIVTMVILVNTTCSNAIVTMICFSYYLYSYHGI